MSDNVGLVLWNGNTGDFNNQGMGSDDAGETSTIHRAWGVAVRDAIKEVLCSAGSTTNWLVTQIPQWTIDSRMIQHFLPL